MPSPRWSDAREAPLFQALAAAQHAAWRVPGDRRRAAFTERFRQLAGPARAELLLSSALAIFDTQSAPPAGFQDPPANMHFDCCPRCQVVSSKRYGQAPNGRVKLNALRDREWLDRQLSVGRSHDGIARQLGCSAATIKLWIDKHGLDRVRHKQNDDEIAALHDAGLAPGEISEKLDITVKSVRDTLKRTRGITVHEGHHYHKKEWWIERLVTKQMTTFDCARAAGIRTHAAYFWLKKFSLQEVVRGRSCRVLRRRWRYKYPQLADPAQLKALMEKHRSYEGVALEVTGSRHGATNVKTWWLTHFGSPPENLKYRRGKNATERKNRSWWTDRLDRGYTMLQLAEEAGITEHSAIERLRVLGGDLLARGYRNNLAAEKAKRAPKPKPWWAKQSSELQEAVNA